MLGSCACVRVSALLGWLGRTGLPGAFWCASPSPVDALGALLVCSAPSGVGLLCLWLLLGFFVFSFFFRPGVPLALASCAPPASPPPLFFSFFFPCAPPCLWCSVVFGPWCRGPCRPVVLPPGPPVFFFLFSPPPPPAFFFFSVRVSCLFAFIFCFCLFSLPWCAGCAALGVCLCVLRCGVCWCVVLWDLYPGGGRFALVLCRWLLLGCACSVCVVACLVAVSWCVLFFTRCCVACLCWAWFLPRAAAPCCRCLVPCHGPWLCSVLQCSAVVLCWPPVVRCGAVCVVSCWSCRVVSFALAGAVCCCLWLPAVSCCIWLPAVVFRWRVLSLLLLPGRVACCPAVCCCLLWYPAPLCCVLCSVVLCRRVVPCCAALLSVCLCWWCWFVSFPCVCGAVLRCASCCSVPVWSALLLVPRAVVCCCVLWSLPWRSVVWWCCSGVSWCLAVPCCVLWCCVALCCRAAGVCCVFCFAAGLPLSFKNHFLVFENKKKQNRRKLYSTQRTHAGRQQDHFGLTVLHVAPRPRR